MHIDLIILTNKLINNSLLENFNYKILDPNIVLKDEYTLENYVTFDYIIIENINSLKNINILKDDNSIICNFFFQTSFEHIFFIGKENNSKKSINEQIDIVLDFLMQ